jgi:hypothetical protein
MAARWVPQSGCRRLVNVSKSPTVASPVDFEARWHTPPNFWLTPDAAGGKFDFTFPSALEVLDVLRHDPRTRVTFLGETTEAERTALATHFTRQPVEEIATWPFRLVHFELFRHYHGILRGFQETVMIPWRTNMASRGFSWQRCYPILFISTLGCSSTYHVDLSHGLVWQVEGRKIFRSHVRPDEVISASDAIRTMTGRVEVPPMDQRVAANVQVADMAAGDLLWSHCLTPHWVTADSPVAMSINISHGGLMRAGDIAMREQVLREHWDRNPSEAWLGAFRSNAY